HADHDRFLADIEMAEAADQAHAVELAGFFLEPADGEHRAIGGNFVVAGPVGRAVGFTVRFRLFSRFCLSRHTFGLAQNFLARHCGPLLCMKQESFVKTRNGAMPFQRPGESFTRSFGRAKPRSRRASSSTVSGSMLCGRRSATWRLRSSRSVRRSSRMRVSRSISASYPLRALRP